MATKKRNRRPAPTSVAGAGRSMAAAYGGVAAMSAVGDVAEFTGRIDLVPDPHVEGLQSADLPPLGKGPSIDLMTAYIGGQFGPGNTDERQRELYDELRRRRLFQGTAMLLDMILEPVSAEDAIGNLAELYASRVAVNPGHAQRWLIAQVFWIVFGRAMDLFGRFMRARAGK